MHDLMMEGTLLWITSSSFKRYALALRGQTGKQKPVVCVDRASMTKRLESEYGGFWLRLSTIWPRIGEVYGQQ